MFKINKIPKLCEGFFAPFLNMFRWDHYYYFRELVIGIAFAYGRKTVSNGVYSQKVVASA